MRFQTGKALPSYPSTGHAQYTTALTKVANHIPRRASVWNNVPNVECQYTYTVHVHVGRCWSLHGTELGNGILIGFPSFIGILESCTRMGVVEYTYMLIHVDTIL